MYIYTPLCRPSINLDRYVLVFIVPHVDIKILDNMQFISNISRIIILSSSFSLTQQETHQSALVRGPLVRLVTSGH